MVKTSPSSAEHAGLILTGEAKIPHASRPKHQNIKQKQYCQNGLQKASRSHHGSDGLLYLLNFFVSFFFLNE